MKGKKISVNEIVENEKCESIETMLQRHWSNSQAPLSFCFCVLTASWNLGGLSE